MHTTKNTLCQLEWWLSLLWPVWLVSLVQLIITNKTIWLEGLEFIVGQRCASLFVLSMVNPLCVLASTMALLQSVLLQCKQTGRQAEQRVLFSGAHWLPWCAQSLIKPNSWLLASNEGVTSIISDREQAGIGKVKRGETETVTFCESTWTAEPVSLRCAMLFVGGRHSFCCHDLSD